MQPLIIFLHLCKWVALRWFLRWKSWSIKEKWIPQVTQHVAELGIEPWSFSLTFIWSITQRERDVHKSYLYISMTFYVTTSNNLDQQEKSEIAAASPKPPGDLAHHNPSSEVTTVLTSSTLDEFCMHFELDVRGIMLFYVWLLFPNSMWVKFIHGDASNGSFPFIAIYFMVEICQNSSVPLLMELGVFPLWSYHE